MLLCVMRELILLLQALVGAFPTFIPIFWRISIVRLDMRYVLPSQVLWDHFCNRGGFGAPLGSIAAHSGHPEVPPQAGLCAVLSITASG